MCQKTGGHKHWIPEGAVEFFLSEYPNHFNELPFLNKKEYSEFIQCKTIEDKAHFLNSLNRSNHYKLRDTGMGDGSLIVVHTKDQ